MNVHPSAGKGRARGGWGGGWKRRDPTENTLFMTGQRAETRRGRSKETRTGYLQVGEWLCCSARFETDYLYIGPFRILLYSSGPYRPTGIRCRRSVGRRGACFYQFCVSPYAARSSEPSKEKYPPPTPPSTVSPVTRGKRVFSETNRGDRRRPGRDDDPRSKAHLLSP